MTRLTDSWRSHLLVTFSGESSGRPVWVDRMEQGTDEGYFGPDSAAWAVHGGIATLVAGIRALLMQTLHPGAMAGVHDWSRYQDDPLGRLSGTIHWLVTVTFADTKTAQLESTRVGVAEAVRFIRNPPLRRSMLPAYRVLFAGAVASLPEQYRVRLGLRASRLPVIWATGVVLRSVRTVLGATSTSEDAARTRIARLQRERKVGVRASGSRGGGSDHGRQVTQEVDSQDGSEQEPEREAR